MIDVHILAKPWNKVDIAAGGKLKGMSPINSLSP